MGLLKVAAVIFSLFTIGYIMMEGFETLVLPRRVERRGRLVKQFYVGLWRLWRGLCPLVPRQGRDTFLATFGPLSLLLLLVVWAAGQISAFALLHWGLSTQVRSPEQGSHLDTYLYLSATTFITLGFGDVAPMTDFGRFVSDIEAGIGFGFLAIVIGYLPVLYGAFSRREVEIALLDARASSPPSAGALLQRIGGCRGFGDLPELLRDFERWAAELLESHLSYPVLMFYRSQHDRQSWLSALTTILDACAFVIAYIPDSKVTWQARMTFAISRHACVDLALVFDTPPMAPEEDRLPLEKLNELRGLLGEVGMALEDGEVGDAAAKRLGELRHLYEPFVNALAKDLELTLPDWLPNPNLPDNWQTSAWDRSDHFFQADVTEPIGSHRLESPTSTP